MTKHVDFFDFLVKEALGNMSNSRYVLEEKWGRTTITENRNFS